jgi:hypothetical protein
MMTIANKYVTHDLPTNVSPKTGRLKRGRKPALTVQQLYALPFSKLIRIAVADAQAAARTPGYKLSMGVWHVPDVSKKTCYVCMAGACMAGTQAFMPKKSVTTLWNDLDDSCAQDLARALNYVRQGSLFSAAEELNRYVGEHSELVDDVGVMIQQDYVDSRDGGRAKWSTYLKAAKMLEKVGL